MDIQAIAERIKVCTVTLSAWRATRKHAAETRAVNEKHSTGHAAKVAVKQCDDDALTSIYKIDASIYVAHRAMTMPTVADGMRMLARGSELKHSNLMREFQDKRCAYLDDLCARYFDIMEKQRAKLNGLFDQRAWPRNLDALRSEFVFSTKYLPTPTDGAWSDWFQESMSAADAELREQVERALRRVIERCTADGCEGRLHETVFSSLSELASMVPDFDFAGKYAPIVQALKPVAAINADTIRDNPVERAKIADSVRDILNVFGGIK
jgi:hypothetical protein